MINLIADAKVSKEALKFNVYLGISRIMGD